MKRLPVAIAASALLVALSGSRILWSSAQTIAPKNKSATSKEARLNAQKRDASTSPLFVDVTRAAKIDFHLTCGSHEKLYIVETQCGGAAAFDYDNDGWMDILLVDGSTVEDYRAGKCHPPRLYHNNHD